MTKCFGKYLFDLDQKLKNCKTRKMSDLGQLLDQDDRMPTEIMFWEHPAVQNFLRTLIRDHYPEEDAPAWVNYPKFVEHKANEVFEDVLDYYVVKTMSGVCSSGNIRYGEYVESNIGHSYDSKHFEYHETERICFVQPPGDVVDAFLKINNFPPVQPRVKPSKPPKRPTSGYMAYGAKRRPELKNSNSAMVHGELTKQIAEEWDKMTPMEKKPYQDVAEIDKIRYQEEMYLWRQSL